MDIHIEPELSFGFRFQNPFDGLNCYLRLVEAYLRAQEVSGSDIPRALLQPLDFRPAWQACDLGEQEQQWYFILPRDVYSQYDRFAGCIVRWRTIDRNPDADLDKLLMRLPILLLPDQYYLPWHVQYKKEHIWTHSLMIVTCQNDTLQIIDTDAGPERKFKRVVARNNQDFVTSIVKVGEIEYQADWRQNWETEFLTMLRLSQHNMPEDLSKLRLLTERLSNPFEDHYFPTFHMGLIITIQPTLSRYIALLDTSLQGTQLLPSTELRQFHRFVNRSFRSLKHAMIKAHRQGTSDHHELAIQTMNQLLVMIDDLCTAILRIRI